MELRKFRGEREEQKKAFSVWVSPHTISSFPMSNEIKQQVWTENLLGTKHFAECFEDVNNKKDTVLSSTIYFSSGDTATLCDKVSCHVG